MTPDELIMAYRDAKRMFDACEMRMDSIEIYVSVGPVQKRTYKLQFVKRTNGDIILTRINIHD